MGISLSNRGFNSLLHTFTPQKRCQGFNSPKPVNKTRSMVPSDSESPLLSIPKYHFSPPSHTLLSQLPLFLCPCSFYLSSAHFYTFIPIYSRDLTIFPHLSLTHSGLSIYLPVMCLFLRFLGAADNSGILPSLSDLIFLSTAKAWLPLLTMPFMTLISY